MAGAYLSMTTAGVWFAMAAVRCQCVRWRIVVFVRSVSLVYRVQ